MVCLGPAAGEVDSTTDRLYNMAKSQTKNPVPTSLGVAAWPSCTCLWLQHASPNVVRLHITYTVLKVHGLELDQDVVVAQSHSMHTIIYDS